jgi:hypothetical protein
VRARVCGADAGVIPTHTQGALQRTTATTTHRRAATQPHRPAKAPTSPRQPHVPRMFHAPAGARWKALHYSVLLPRANAPGIVPWPWTPPPPSPSATATATAVRTATIEWCHTQPLVHVPLQCDARGTRGRVTVRWCAGWNCASAAAGPRPCHSGVTSLRAASVADGSESHHHSCGSCESCERLHTGKARTTLIRDKFTGHQRFDE